MTKKKKQSFAEITVRGIRNTNTVTGITMGSIMTIMVIITRAIMTTSMEVTG